MIFIFPMTGPFLRTLSTPGNPGAADAGVPIPEPMPRVCDIDKAELEINLKERGGAEWRFTE